MRKRVLLPLMLFCMVAVLALTVFACEALASARTRELAIARSTAVEHIVRLAERATAEGETDALERYLDRFVRVYGESVTVVDGAGEPVIQVGEIGADQDRVAELAANATSNLPQWNLSTIRPWSPGLVVVAEPVLGPGEVSTGAVVLQVNQSSARADVTLSWALIGLVGLLFLGGLGGASLWWTGWVLRPVRELDEAANAFPLNRIDPAVATGPPELRRLAGSFSRMADGVTRTLTQQRSFVADASHQLRNPLAAIRLRVDAIEPAEHADTITAVDRDLDRLEHTVDRMLALADAEHRATAATSGSASDRESEGRNEHTIASAQAMIQPFLPLMEAAGVQVRAIDTGPVRVRCRRSDLEEIVSTLLDNAARYAGRGSTVTVAVTREASLVRISVSDDGDGLSDEELSLAGTRFWRGQQQRDVPGTGLGLAIVSEIVRANGGDFELSHAGEGGLRATVSFPVLDEDPR